MSSLYIGARAEGVSSIANGRVFLLSTLSWKDAKNGDLIPEPIENFDLTISGTDKKCTMLVAGPDMPVICPTCGGMFKQYLLCHTYDWMQSVFYCDDHKETAWLDLFPKAAPDTTQDHTNAFQVIDPNDITQISDPQKKGAQGIILGYQSPRERYRKHIQETDIRYILAPKGLQRIGGGNPLSAGISPLKKLFCFLLRKNP